MISKRDQKEKLKQPPKFIWNPATMFFRPWHRHFKPEKAYVRKWQNIRTDTDRYNAIRASLLEIGAHVPVEHYDNVFLTKDGWFYKSKNPKEIVCETPNFTGEIIRDYAD